LIVVIDVFPGDFRRILRYGKKHNIVLLHDSVEWYSPEEFNNGAKHPEYILKEKTNRKMVGKGWRVMAISTYLENHFKELCDKVERIPVIMDVYSIPCGDFAKTIKDKISISYVGSPVKKDYLKVIVDGICLLSENDRNKMRLHIVGVNQQQLVNVCGVNEDTIHVLGETLIAHGRVPHEVAIQYVQNADYTILIRDETLRYAKAGFPTKIVESLSCGTPPICNLSSDLGMYLKDGENAIIAKSHSPEAVKDAVEKAINLSAEERVKMRVAARRTAERHFDYKNFTSQMESLVN
jgi:glycosyltransferase involved in cell wall biosynthesis